MKPFFTASMSRFWISVMEKLSTDTDANQAIYDMIKEVCHFFHFGCSFIYVAGHEDNFMLYQSYQVYSQHHHLNDVIMLKEKLNAELYQQFIRKQYITFDNTVMQTRLDQTLAAEFHAQAMILLPIFGNHHEITALIGMVDRRGESREGEQDIRFAHAMLAIIANYVKTLLSQREIENTMKTLSNVLDHTGVDIAVIDFETDDILYVNQSLAQQYGGRENLIGISCRETFVPPDTDPDEFYHKTSLINAERQPTDVYTWNHYNAPTGTWTRLLASAFHWIDGRLAIVISSIDITESKESENKIRQYAEYDTLTGLGNRHKLLIDCDDGINRLKSEQRKGYLVFCDLNNFKEVNDSMGHQTGDELLKLMGRSLEDHPLTQGRTYRYGGDEFVILCFDHTLEEAKRLKETVLELFNRPWILSGAEICCTTSAGITCYPDDALTTSDLLHCADQEMYHAKAAVRQRQAKDPVPERIDRFDDHI